jgi:hypothetical protein
MEHQLCLPLTDVGYKLNRRGGPRPVPDVVTELFDLCDRSPSGLVWRVASKNGRAKVGDPAGSPQGNYWLVSVRGHGLYYAHRVVYFLRTKQNPGSMVVRHLGSDELVLGWQSDNGRDEKGVPKKKTLDRSAVTGRATKNMYHYKDSIFNMKSLCEHLGLNYSTVYQRVHRCNMSPEEAFAVDGVFIQRASED